MKEDRRLRETLLNLWVGECCQEKVKLKLRPEDKQEAATGAAGDRAVLADLSPLGRSSAVELKQRPRQRTCLCSHSQWGSENNASLVKPLLLYQGTCYRLQIKKGIIVSTMNSSCLVAKSCATFCKSMNCSTPGFPVLHCLQSLLKLMYIESVMPSNHLILCHPLLFLPSIFPGIRVFSSELALCIRWPNYWSFSFSINPSSEYSGLISCRLEWLVPLAHQGTLKSLLQDHSLKASIVWHSAFFMVPTLTSIHDYWKNQSFDYTELCRQSDISVFKYAV